MHLISVINTILISLAHAQASNHFGFHFMRLGVSHNADKDHPRNLSRLVEDWIEQPFDHFSTNETRTWKMMYCKRLDLWKPNGPILIYIGGEAPITPNYIDGDSTLIEDLAKETNAALYASEHRYYGSSQLMPEPRDYRFLSSQQALADLAQLIRSIKSAPEFKSSKVIVVGGSYAGNLAAWMRVRYSDLVDAAVSISGPVLAKKDFHEYLDVVGDVYKRYGTPGCLQKIIGKMAKYNEMLKTSQGINTLKIVHNICEDVDMNVKENQQLAFFWIFNNYIGVPQYGSPNKIVTTCENTDIIPSVSKSIGPNIFTSQDPCIDCTFDRVYTPHLDIKYRPWLYQVCTEFGYFVTSESSFPFKVPMEYFVKMCTNIFGSEFSEKRIDDGIAHTNAVYGGRTPNVTRVVFTNGDMDPWHALGVLRDLSQEAPARVVNGTSHCRLLLRSSPGEPRELMETRNYVKNLIKKWIGSQSLVTAPTDNRRKQRPKH